MTTCKELYDSKVYTFGDVDVLKGCYYDHITEAELGWNALYGASFPLIEVRVLKDFDFDGRRFWRLATVWFEGSSVMVIQNAGQEGDDHARRFITNADAFNKMCCYIKVIVNSSEEDVLTDVYNEGYDFGDILTTFYGNELNGHFERYKF